MTPGEIFLAVGGSVLAGAVTWLIVTVRDINKRLAELLDPEQERAERESEQERAEREAHEETKRRTAELLAKARSIPPAGIFTTRDDPDWPYHPGRHAVTDDEATEYLPITQPDVRQ